MENVIQYIYIYIYIYANTTIYKNVNNKATNNTYHITPIYT